MANPEIAANIQLYPEIVEGPLSEVWQAGRWKEFKRSELNPMFAHGLKHFYVDELAELDSGDIVIPLIWIKWRGEVYADCIDVVRTEVSHSLSNLCITLITLTNSTSVGQEISYYIGARDPSRQSKLLQIYIP